MSRAKSTMSRVKSSMSRVKSFWLRHSEKDITSPISAKLTGKLPVWLRGNLYRNGSAIKEIGPDRYNHLFDGLACLHKFHIDGEAGQVTYQSRFLESEHYKTNRAAERIAVSEFGTLGRQDLCQSIFGRLMATFQDLRGRPRDTSDNCAVNVGFYGSELYAMTEGNLLWRVSPEDLAAEERLDLSRVVAVNSATAHPHVADDGTVYNVGSSFSDPAGPCVKFIEFPAKGNEEGSVAESGRIVASLPHRWSMEPSYFHSFGMTERFFVFVQQPLVIQVKQVVMLKLRQRPITEAIATKPQQGTWIRLIDRRTGEIHPTTFTADTFYTFHHVNAYEKDGHVVVDVCALRGIDNFMERADLQYMSSDEVEDDNPMLRFSLPLDSKPGTMHCAPEQLTPPEYRSVDLPRINYRFNGRPYRYTYCCQFVGAAGNSERMLKLDLEAGQTTVWSDPLWSPSEPVFVARTSEHPTADAAEDPAAEDDGVLLASLLHVDDPCRVALVVLDAANMQELARADVTTDATVAKDFHGLFAASGDSVHGY